MKWLTWLLLVSFVVNVVIVVFLFFLGKGQEGLVFTFAAVLSMLGALISWESHTDEFEKEMENKNNER